MSPMEAARLLVADGLENDHPCGGCWAKLYLREPHTEDCPLLLAMPRIVAVIEAAERLIDRGGEDDRAEWVALATALDAPNGKTDG